jgi:hypothetical protein
MFGIVLNVQFKDFISRQRITILFVGAATFAVSLLVSHTIGFASLWGELFIDLAASAITVIFTTLIIDYLGLKEQSTKTLNAAALAEDEIRATCYRVKWRLARLFGLERDRSGGNDNISNREEAKEYLSKITGRVDDFLSEHDLMENDISVHMESFQRYLERLQSSQVELEQTLILYEYALPYSLRERVLTLRSELQIAERLLGFIDTSESLNNANISLIKVTAQSVYEAVEEILQHGSQINSGTVIQDINSIKS